MQEVNVPEERKPVLIGTDGSVKREIESEARVSITIGEGVTIEGDDPIMVMKAADVVRAIGRGFAPDKAMILLSDEYELRVVSLLGESENTRKRLMARVIGKRGATRKILESDTNCLISVYGKTVGIIGKMDEVAAAERAVEAILKGHSHGYVYSRIRKKQA